MTDEEAHLDRRRALTLLGGAGLAVLVGCGGGADDAGSDGGGGSTTAAAGDGADCETIPEETAGPYPGDGSNGPDVLAEKGIVRRDIRPNLGSVEGVADGVDLTIQLVVRDRGNGCGPRPGAAVYVWHCDREANYSMYSRGVTEDNYLRGVQAAGEDGRVTFTSIFPGAYEGRWPHVHFSVYPYLDAATGGGEPLITSQFAFPDGACREAYAAEGYEDSVENLSGTSLEADAIFRDGAGRQLATVEGSAADGYTASLDVVI